MMEDATTAATPDDGERESDATRQENTPGFFSPGISASGTRSGGHPQYPIPPSYVTRLAQRSVSSA